MTDHYGYKPEDIKLLEDAPTLGEVADPERWPTRINIVCVLHRDKFYRMCVAERS